MKFIVGVDEAGRGPLAGPVAVGAVKVSPRLNLLKVFPGLNDSKQLSEEKREELFMLLRKRAANDELSFCVRFSSALVIDRRGLVRAVTSATHRSVRTLLPEPSEGKVYLDGLLYAPEEYEQETLTGGDGLLPAIMLASVAAKVARDRRMRNLARRYPGYDFEEHKGYGTKAHYKALRTLGPSDIHRELFLRKFRAQNGLA